jgi:hypothetical protein
MNVKFSYYVTFLSVAIPLGLSVTLLLILATPLLLVKGEAEEDWSGVIQSFRELSYTNYKQNFSK